MGVGEQLVGVLDSRTGDQPTEETRGQASVKERDGNEKK